MPTSCRRTLAGIAAAAALFLGLVAVASAADVNPFSAIDGGVASEQAERVQDENVGPDAVRRLTANAPFDYQIGGDYTPSAATDVVTRDWRGSTSATSAPRRTAWPPPIIGDRSLVVRRVLFVTVAGSNDDVYGEC